MHITERKKESREGNEVGGIVGDERDKYSEDYAINYRWFLLILIKLTVWLLLD